MAKVFETWTALPHEPLEKLASNLWSVSGTMPSGTIQRRMTLVRLASGGLVIHNAVALDEPSMAELESFGEPAFLLVPNGYHRQDALIYKRRYPKLRVLCPRATTKKVGEVVALDGSYDDLPTDTRVSLFHLRGLKEREGALRVESDDGSSLVFNDAVLNLTPRSGLMGFALAPTGRPSVPRAVRWLTVSDKQAFRGHLEELASTTDLRRVVVGHGATIVDDAGPALSAVASGLA